MSVWEIIGIISLLVGVFLIGFGIRSAQTLTDKVVEKFTGRYPKETMLFLIGGALLALTGLFLLFTIKIDH